MLPECKFPLFLLGNYFLLLEHEQFVWVGFFLAFFFFSPEFQLKSLATGNTWYSIITP